MLLFLALKSKPKQLKCVGINIFSPYQTQTFELQIVIYTISSNKHVFTKNEFRIFTNFLTI